MPWYGFYSEKQARLFGIAEYINSPYKDSTKLGHLTHFCGVMMRTSTKANQQLTSKYLYADIIYDRDNLILN
jgi:hypothetical protein